MAADNVFDFPFNKPAGTDVGNIFQTATGSFGSMGSGLPSGYNFGVSPNELDPYAEFQNRLSSGGTSFGSNTPSGLPNLFQTATGTFEGGTLPTVVVNAGAGSGSSSGAWLPGTVNTGNIFDPGLGGGGGGLITMATMFVSTDTTPTAMVSLTPEITPTNTGEIVQNPPFVVNEPTISVTTFSVTPGITVSNTGAIITDTPMVITEQRITNPVGIVTDTPMIVTGGRITESTLQVTMTTPTISVNLGTPTISVPTTTPAATVSVSITVANPFTTPATAVPSPTPTSPGGTDQDWWRNFMREGGSTLEDLNRLYPGMLDLYTRAAQGYGSADAARLAQLSGAGGGFAQSQGNLNALAAQQTAAANTALRQGNLADAQNLAMQAEQLKRQANPELYAAMQQFQGAAGGQVGSDLARLQAAQARQLSPEDVRNAQQAAREAYSARGLVMGPGAIGAEILNRENLARQREQEARQNLATSMGQLYQGIGARTANVFDPLAATLGQQYGMQSQNVGMTGNLMNQLGQLTAGGYGNQYVQNQYNPFNPYAQDVYSSNFNARMAQQLAAANNAAALEAARIQGEAAKAAGQTNLAGQLGGAVLPSLLKLIPGICWVAREVYGEDNPKWLLFRHWVLNHAPESFRNWYTNNGEAFAEWLRRNHWAKPAIRAFMDSRINTLNQVELLKSYHSHAL